MNKSKIIYWGMLVLILAISYGTMSIRSQAVTSGKTVFVPLVKENPVTPTNRGLLLNFKQLIPDKQRLSSSGTIVVYINSFGVISFVRTLEGKKAKELAFGEQLLDYGAYRPAGFYATKKPKIFFGARYLPLSDEDIAANSANIKRARYLILRVSPAGYAVPIGLADRNYGNLLQSIK